MLDNVRNSLTGARHCKSSLLIVQRTKVDNFCIYTFLKLSLNSTYHFNIGLTTVFTGTIYLV